MSPAANDDKFCDPVSFSSIPPEPKPSVELSSTASRNHTVDRNPGLSLNQTEISDAGMDWRSELEAQEVEFIAWAESKYKFHRLIGKGGMGSIFLVTPHSMERHEALKFLGRTRSDGQDSGLQEARFLSLIQRDDVVRIYTVSSDSDPFSYFTMELIDGHRTFENLINDYDQVVSPRERRQWLLRLLMVFERVCIAVSEMHAKGIMHLDLKPQNIGLRQIDQDRESPVLFDFGIAQSSETTGRNPAGTPSYMAPEQAVEEGVVSFQTDVYLLGAILFHILSNSPPHGAPPKSNSDLPAFLQKIATGEPPLLLLEHVKCHPHLAAIQRKAMAKHPTERFQSPQAIADEIDAVLSHNAPSRTLDWREPFNHRVSRTFARYWQKSFAILILSVVVTLTTLAVFAIRGAREASETMFWDRQRDIHHEIVRQGATADLDDAQRRFDEFQALAKLDGRSNDPRESLLTALWEQTLGVLHARVGQYLAAMSKFENALKLAESEVNRWPETWRFLPVELRIRIAAALSDFGRHKEAKSQFFVIESTWLKGVPDSVLLMFLANRGELNYDSQDVLGAIRDWELALKVWPHFDKDHWRTDPPSVSLVVDCISCLAVAYEDVGDSLNAKKYSERLESILDDMPKAETVASMIDAAFNSNRIAKQRFQEGAYSASMHWRESAITESGYVLAIDAGLVSAKETHSVAWMGKAECHMVGREQYQEALYAWNKADEYDNGTNRSRIRSSTKYCQIRTGDWRAAEELDEYYKEEGDEFDESVLYNVACSYSLAIGAIQLDANISPEIKASRTDFFGNRAVDVLGDLERKTTDPIERERLQKDILGGDPDFRFLLVSDRESETTSYQMRVLELLKILKN